MSIAVSGEWGQLELPREAAGRACEWLTAGWGGAERRQCARGAVFQFGGQELCGPHHQQLMEDIAAELHVSEWFRRRIKREMTRALDDTDWQLRQPVAGCGTQVYFVQRHQAVKIGYATDVRDRMKAIAAGSGIIPGMVAGPVKLLASFPGGRDREKSLHRRFAELRIGGEWFLLNAQLKGFIGAIES